MSMDRLQKVIAQAGLASRRAAEEMILQERVEVNGRIVTELGLRVDPEKDEIRVDKKLISIVATKTYLLFNKPARCVTTVKDPQGRKTVLDYVRKQIDIRVFPVGRLDYDAEGLLLLTNDGFLANRLQHPRYGVNKTYEVKVKGKPPAASLDQLRRGVALREGITSPAEVSVLRALPDATWLEIVIHQGWYRQIKRMCEAVGHPVVKIRRIAYGPLVLGKLQPGSFRALSRSEIKKLYDIAKQKQETT
jgi:pseudouridine synthase